VFGFEKLTAWQKAVEYADHIYKVTRSFPADERFGLTSQLRRSAVSVSSNIAEGSSRSSRTDFARFVEIAYGSVLESISELTIAKRQEFVNDAMFNAAYKKAEELAKMLSSFRTTLRKGSR